MTTRRVLAIVGFLCAAGTAAGDGEPVLRLDAGGPAAYTPALAFSPDGRTLYAGGFDKVVRVWTLDETAARFVAGKVAAYRVPIGPGLHGAVNTLAVSPDGRQLAVAGLGLVR